MQKYIASILINREISKMYPDYPSNSYVTYYKVVIGNDGFSNYSIDYKLNNLMRYLDKYHISYKEYKKYKKVYKKVYSNVLLS
jgi:hypothetical protein